MDRDREEIQMHVFIRLLNITGTTSQIWEITMCLRESRERVKVHILATSYTITATEESLI